MSTSLSRNSLAWLVGVGWGLALGYFGPLPIALLGPPLVLWISAKRPLLNSQAPIIPGILLFTILTRNKGNSGSGGPADTAGSLLAMVLAMWLLCTLLSLPWIYIFQRVARKAPAGRPIETPTTATFPRVGVVLAVFFAFVVVLLGFALMMYPGELRARLPGALIAAAGVGLSLFIYWAAHRLGIGTRVKDILELPLVLGAVFGILSLVLAFYNHYFPLYPSAQPEPAGPVFSAESLLCGIMVLESVAGLFLFSRVSKWLAT